MSTTLIPLFVLAFLSAPPERVTSWLVPQENVICYYADNSHGVCLPYRDDGTHLTISLNEVLYD